MDQNSSKGRAGAMQVAQALCRRQYCSSTMHTGHKLRMKEAQHTGMWSSTLQLQAETYLPVLLAIRVSPRPAQTTSPCMAAGLLLLFKPHPRLN
jgi:hypothetical protein